MIECGPRSRRKHFDSRTSSHHTKALCSPGKCNRPYFGGVRSIAEFPTRSRTWSHREFFCEDSHRRWSPSGMTGGKGSMLVDSSYCVTCSDSAEQRCITEMGGNEHQSRYIHGMGIQYDQSSCRSSMIRATRPYRLSHYSFLLPLLLLHSSCRCVRCTG